MTFIPTQAATRDLTVCWMPSLHTEQGAMSTRGPRAAFSTVGARSAGRIRPLPSSITWGVRTWSSVPTQRSNGEAPSIDKRVMFPGATVFVRGVIIQRGSQQPFKCRAPPEVEKHEPLEIHSAHPIYEIFPQCRQVEGQKRWGDRDRQLLQVVLRCEGVHLDPRRRCSGKHQIVQRAARRGVRGEWETILGDCRNTS